MSDKIMKFPRRSDSDGLSKVSAAFAALAAWEPKAPRLGRDLFIQGMALIADSHSKELQPEAAMAFWVALSDVAPEDFIPGVARVLKRERFITPAAVAEACAEVRDSRAAQARREREEAEARQWAAERHERENRRKAREEQIRAEVDAWAMPPATVEELRERVLLLLELERFQGNMSRPEMTARRAEWSGTVADLVLAVEGGGLGLDERSRADLSAMATKAAGHPIKVTVRVAGVQASKPRLTSEEDWEARRAKLKRQAEEIKRDTGGAA